MILSDRMIKEAMAAGDIVIEPFNAGALGSNSYDVHLGPLLRTYATVYETVSRPYPDAYYGSPPMVCKEPAPLDCKVERATVDHPIPGTGFVLKPGTLYLGSTIEYTETHKHIPYFDGKSSIGRLGITIHCTAGRGDVGFCNHWTMEIHVVQPVRIYAGMPIGQITYALTGDVDVPYNEKPNAKYNEREPHPQASRMWRNFK